MLLYLSGQNDRPATQVGVNVNDGLNYVLYQREREEWQMLRPPEEHDPFARPPPPKSVS